MRANPIEASVEASARRGDTDSGERRGVSPTWRSSTSGSEPVKQTGFSGKSYRHNNHTYPTRRWRASWPGPTRPWPCHNNRTYLTRRWPGLFRQWLGPSLPPSLASHVAISSRSARSLTPHATLWATANHRATALTFSTPRTRNRNRPRFRVWALTHSIVAARCL